MGKRTAEVVVMVVVMAISVEVGLCSLDNTVFQALSPPPPESGDSWSTWLHSKYQQAFNQAELEPRDTARNLMESAENTAAKAKDTITSAARGFTDSVIRMVDSYDFHPDWPTEDQDDRMSRSSSTSYSKFDSYAARMANRAAETESDSEGDFTDHMIEGMDYGRSRLSNSYDHLKQNVNAGIDKAVQMGAEAMDRVGKTMESRDRMHIDREHRIDHETMDRVPKTMESRERMNIDREHRIDHTCDFGAHWKDKEKDGVYGASHTSREHRVGQGFDSGTQGKDESKAKAYGFGKEKFGAGEKMKKAKEEL